MDKINFTVNCYDYDAENCDIPDFEDLDLEDWYKDDDFMLYLGTRNRHERSEAEKKFREAINEPELTDEETINAARGTVCMFYMTDKMGFSEGSKSTVEIYREEYQKYLEEKGE